MTKTEQIAVILQDIDARISHIEDMTADNRDTIIKLVKQGNQIVEFLRNIEIEDVTDDYIDNITTISSNEEIAKTNERMVHIRELVDEFMQKNEELQEFEKELKKHKDKLTPGQVGES